MSDTPIKDGGPAFPGAYFDHLEGIGEVRREQYHGMTLRDWFATHAPEIPDWFDRKKWTQKEWVPAPEVSPGYVKSEWVTHKEPTIEHLTRWKYHYADAMLAERAKEVKP